MSGTLNHTPAQVIRQLLIQLGQGSASSAWPVFHGSEPDSPDKVLTVYNTLGPLQARKQVDGEWVERYGIQVRVRADTNANASIKSNVVSQTLDTGVYQSMVTLDGSNYLVHSLSRTSGPLDMMKNMPASKRSIYTINYLATINLLA